MRGREKDMKTVRQSYVKRLRDNYLLILRTLMHDLIVSIDEQGNFVLVNDAAVKFWGKPSKKIVGTHFTEYLHPDDIKKATAALQDLINGKSNVKSFMLRMNSPKGFRTVAWNGVAVLDDKKNYIGAQATGKDLTDLLHAQKELEQSKQHFRRLFEVIVDPIVIVDMSGKILEFSQSAEEILGFPRNELVGKHFLETNVATPESKAIMDTNLMKLKKGMYISAHTIEVITKSGKKLLYELNPTRIIYKGEPSILAIFRNITEQKKAEEKLRASEERFNYFLDNAPEAIWIQDLNGIFLYGNKMAEKLTGYKKEELIRKSMLGLLIQPESVSKVLEKFKVNKPGEISGPIELELKKKDGSLISIEASTIPVEREGNLEIIGITRDITERKKTKEALQESEKRFRELIKLLPEIIFEMDLTGRLTFVNDVAFERFGYSQHDFDKGLNAFQMLIEKDRDKAKEEITKTFTGTDVGFSEYTALKKDGTTFPIIIHSTPIIRGNRPVGSRGLIVDITDRKKTEEDLMESEEKYRSLFENMLNGFSYCKIILDDRGKPIDFVYLEINDAFEKITGLKKDNVVGKPVSEAIPETIENHPELFETYGRVALTGKEEQFDIFFKPFALWLHISVYSPKHGYFVAVFEDITVRKNSEELLKKSEERFRSTLEGMIEGCQIVDFDWRYIYVNAAAAKHGGLTKKVFLGKTMMEIYPGIDKTELFSALSICMNERVSKRMENEFVFPNGETAWFELSIEPVPEGLFILSVDITDRKEVEVALRQEREMLETITGNINAGLMVVSKDYIVLWANKVLTNYVGNLEGKHCYSAINHLDDVCHGCGVKEVFETGKDWVVHQQMVPTPDGQEVYLEITTTAIRDGTGEIVAASEMSWDITERKKTEKQLKESLQKFRTIFEGATDGILAADPRTQKFAFANPRMYEITGYAIGELPKLGLADVIPKKDLAFVADQFQKQLTGKTPLTRNVPILRKDKTIVYCDISSKLMKMGDQQYLIGFFRDVTEQKKVEDALKESEKKYKSIINAMKDMVWVIDFEGTFVDVNDTAVEVLGYSREELLSMGAYDIDVSMSKEEIMNFIKLLPEAETQLFETSHLTKNGKEIPVEICSTLVTYNGKQAILSIARDITERKKAEEALLESEGKYRTMINTMTDTVWVIGFDGKNIDVNNAAVDVLGYSREELLNMGPADFDNSLTSEQILGLLQKVKAEGKMVFEATHTTKDGRTFPVEISTGPVTYRGKDAVLSIARDITERKKAEEAINKINNLLTQSNKELESYTYVVSHDLKAPLRTIKSFGSFILEDYKDKLDETGQDYLNRMINASSRMDNMIEDLLILSRVGRKFTEIEKVNLNKLLEEILIDLEATINETNTKIVIDKLPFISAPRVWLKQLFMNLINNALKFNESKTPKIEVLYQEKETEHLFKVRDNGIGIEEKYLERIFNLFERAPTEKPYDGTGAGLSICKKIVEHFGGKIWVESTLGKGSTFIFTISKEIKKVKEK